MSNINLKFSIFNKATKELEYSDQLFSLSTIKSYKTLLSTFFLCFKNKPNLEYSVLLGTQVLFSHNHNNNNDNDNNNINDNIQQMQSIQSLDTPEDFQDIFQHLYDKKDDNDNDKKELNFIIQFNIVFKTKEHLIKELTLANKDLLNKRLIKPGSKDYFDFLYTKHFECILCKEILFDPVCCSNCNGIFCRNCVYDLRNNYKNFSVLRCLHSEIEECIEMKERFQLEKIKVNCYFKCGSSNLNLLNYASHLRNCNTNKNNNSEKTNVNVNEIGTENIKKDNDKIEVNELNKFNEKELAALNEDIINLSENKNENHIVDQNEIKTECEITENVKKLHDIHELNNNPIEVININEVINKNDSNR